jgi:DNA replication protein DnaD
MTCCEFNLIQKHSEKTDGAIKNEQSRENNNRGYTKHRTKTSKQTKHRTKGNLDKTYLPEFILEELMLMIGYLV